ncbi:hypothetical protein MVES1_002234 [Malassezia vespertilionis]|uniref:uncharacterized protein n=1 Tax=Malassezia vespertilionis TaxID=2020962 RepID=UPI0024B1C2EE|nr:uncharacterized protein MVES1_002234 [Malassezia vespertilionis]WFD06879.1 hypothetical protein MVES1_002234 [Malassezia vespertilionis]
MVPASVTVESPAKKTASRRAKTEATIEPLYMSNAPVASDEAPFSFGHLPDPSKWKSAFSFTKEHMARHRYFVARRETAQEIVSKIGLDDAERRGRKVTVVEAYAGPGTITRELMQHPNVERVVALENVTTFLPWLEQLYHDPAMAAHKEKLHILPESGFAWDTYETLVNGGYLAHLENKVPNLGEHAPPMHWDEPSPIVFVAQIPNTVHGEQLYAQLVHAISSGFWLFKYGRVKMVFVCGEAVAVEHKNRAKLGTTVQCLSTPELLIPASDLQPYADYFYPPTPSIGPRVPVTSTFIPNSNISSGLSKRNLCVLSVDPLKKKLVQSRDLDAFEFLTRNLFVLKTKQIAEALKHVVPGAANILKLVSPEHPRMKDHPEQVILPDTPVVDLTNEQWAALAMVFEKWPFRPQNLFEEGRLQRGKNADNQFF